MRKITNRTIGIGVLVNVIPIDALNITQVDGWIGRLSGRQQNLKTGAIDRPKIDEPKFIGIAILPYL